MPPKKPTTSKSGKKAPPNRSRPPKKPGKGKGPLNWRLHLALLVAAALLIGLVLLSRREERQPPPPPQPPPAAAIDASAAAREEVEAFLAAAAIPPGAISREPADHPRHYQVRHRLPGPQAIEQLRQRLHRQSPPLELAVPEDGALSVIDSQGRSLLTLNFLPPPPAPQAVSPAPGKRGKVAIIVDDLGRGTRQASQLLAIGQPVTFAILPGESHAAQVAELAHAAGREVMLHAPMEPQGFPVIDPGDDALLLSQSETELRARMAALLKRVPHVAGVNNHMGSRFTEDEPAMAAIMAVLREEGLFFVDSLTSSRSVGAAMAANAGVAAGRRDVFLDNVADVAAIVQQIRLLAGKARRNGSAIGICHPYPETLQALRQELPKLAGEGIEFVPVSALVKGGG
jgi:polysaccharide deacetylase 2 family uncharacterized protein YibQ